MEVVLQVIAKKYHVQKRSYGLSLWSESEYEKRSLTKVFC